MTMSSGIFLIFLVVSRIAAEERRIPSNTDIEDYDDPVLREVFKKKTQPQRLGPDPSPYQQYQTPYGPSYPYYTQQPSIYQPQQYPYYSQGSNQGQYPQQGQGLTNLAAQGATSFYSGAQQVGQAFGIQPGGYQSPFVDTAASFFG